MNEDNAYHLKRERSLAAMRIALENHKLDPETEAVIKPMMTCIEEVSHDVEAAHDRISLRKHELESVTENIKKLAQATRNTSEGIEQFQTVQQQENRKMMDRINAQSKSNKRFMVASTIIGGCIMCVLICLFIGGKEAMSILSALSQVFKLANLIV